MIVTLLSASGSRAVVTMPDEGQTDERASAQALRCVQGFVGQWRVVHVLRCDRLETLGGERSEGAVASEPLDPDPSETVEEAAVSAPSEDSPPGPRIISKGDVSDLILLRRGSRCGSLGAAMVDAAKEATNG